MKLLRYQSRIDYCLNFSVKCLEKTFLRCNENKKAEMIVDILFHLLNVSSSD